MLLDHCADCGLPWMQFSDEGRASVTFVAEQKTLNIRDDESWQCEICSIAAEKSS